MKSKHTHHASKYYDELNEKREKNVTLESGVCSLSLTLSFSSSLLFYNVN